MGRKSVYVLEIFGGTLQFVHGPLTENGAKNQIEETYRRQRKADLAAGVPDVAELQPRFVILEAAPIPDVELLDEPQKRAGTEHDRRRARPFTERRKDGTTTQAPPAPAPAEDEGGPLSQDEALIHDWRAQGFTHNPTTGEPLWDEEAPAGSPLAARDRKPTVSVEPNTVPHMDLINFYGVGFPPGADLEIRYLDFVLTKRADEEGSWQFGISASAIHVDDWGTIKATVSLRGERRPLASCSFTVVE